MLPHIITALVFAIVNRLTLSCTVVHEPSLNVADRDGTTAPVSRCVWNLRPVRKYMPLSAAFTAAKAQYLWPQSLSPPKPESEVSPV